MSIACFYLDFRCLLILTPHPSPSPLVVTILDGNTAWEAGTDGTLGNQGVEAHPPPNTPPENGFGSPAGPPAAAGGNGWLDSSGQHDSSVGFAGTAATDGAAAAPAVALRKAKELELEVALAEAQKELEEARKAAEELR